MNIEDLTIAQARQLAALFGASTATAKPHPFVGQYVIARCYSAGVHAGEVVSADGENVILKDSRRLWSLSQKRRRKTPEPSPQRPRLWKGRRTTALA